MKMSMRLMGELMYPAVHSLTSLPFCFSLISEPTLVPAPVSEIFLMTSGRAAEKKEECQSLKFAGSREEDGPAVAALLAFQGTIEMAMGASPPAVS